jgi:cobyrinic acid a,c-diamide synthase
VERIAAGAPALDGPAWSPGPPRPARTRIAVARGPAFSFHYQENLELLAAAGAELADVDPLQDEALPAGAGALVLAGGFPEVHGAELSANAALREEIAAFARAGRPVLAECGGYLYLCRELDGRPMCGVVPARGEMTDRLTLGYREAAARADGPGFAAGAATRGHEFHYSRVVPDAGVEPAPAWRLRSSTGAERDEGMSVGATTASYLHTHWAATPEAAERLVAAAEAARPAAAGARWA